MEDDQAHVNAHPPVSAKSLGYFDPNMIENRRRPIWIRSVDQCYNEPFDALNAD